MAITFWISESKASRFTNTYHKRCDYHFISQYNRILDRPPLLLTPNILSSLPVGLCRLSVSLKNISFEEEPIINTEDSSVLYYELLSRVRNVGVLDFINAMRRTNLLTFHTILLIETVKNAKSNNSHEILWRQRMPECVSGHLFNFAKFSTI